MNRPIPTLHGIPALGMGTYPLLGDACISTVRMAIDLGFRHIDTAQMYGNETDVGRAAAACGVARDELFITTKVDPSNLTPARFANSVRTSIAALGGPPDLLLIHWPPADADVETMLDLLAAAQDQGDTRLIGVSNFSSSLLRRAKAVLGDRVVCNQVEFHPLLDQRKLKAVADELDVALVAYSPIARGKALSHPVVAEIAERMQRPPSEIVLRWIVQSGVIAIPMTTKKANAASNLAIFDFELAGDDMAKLSAIGTTAGRTIAPDWMRGRWDV
jgi:2,5-diketo-D-gluconate reductase B